jgi:hypothetical protein
MEGFWVANLVGVAIGFVVSGCSHTDYTPGSRLWYSNAPDKEIQAHLKDQPVTAICRTWTQYETGEGMVKAKRRFQDAAGAELQNRGMSPMTCAAGANQAVTQKQLREAREAAEAARSAAERANWNAQRNW